MKTTPEIQLLEHRIKKEFSAEIRLLKDEILTLKRSIRDLKLVVTQARQIPISKNNPHSDLAPQMREFLKLMPPGRYQVEELLAAFIQHTPAARDMSKIAFGKLAQLPKIRVRDPANPDQKVNLYLLTHDPQ